MTTEVTNIDNELLKTTLSATATLIVGILVFIMSAITLFFTIKNNKRNYNLLFEKDKREKQKSYNRVLGSFLKVFHSHIKHKMLFEESGNNIIPDNYLIRIAEKIDSLIIDIRSFKETIDKETEILPELTITLHSFLDLLGRYEIIISEIPEDLHIDGVENPSLVLQRAHNFATRELMDEQFSIIIEKLADKAEVSETFLDDAREFNSEEFINTSNKIQEQILNKYIESINRQTGKNFTVKDIITPSH